MHAWKGLATMQRLQCDPPVDSKGRGPVCNAQASTSASASPPLTVCMHEAGTDQPSHAALWADALQAGGSGMATALGWSGIATHTHTQHACAASSMVAYCLGLVDAICAATPPPPPPHPLHHSVNAAALLPSSPRSLPVHSGEEGGGPARAVHQPYRLFEPHRRSLTHNYARLLDFALCCTHAALLRSSCGLPPLTSPPHPTPAKTTSICTVPLFPTAAT